MNRCVEICVADEACVSLLQVASHATGPHALPQRGRHGSGRRFRSAGDAPLRNTAG